MEFSIEEFKQIDKKTKTEEILTVDDLLSEPISNRVGEKKIKSGIVTITPEIAMQLLTRNPCNRDVKPANIHFLVKEINEGRWVVNGESIKIDYEGNLMDGQHRLWACIKSDTPIRTNVIIGIAPSTIGTIDTGTRRIAKDLLDMHSIPNSTLISSTVKLIHQFDKGVYGDLGGSSRVLSNQEVLDFYYANENKLNTSVNLGSSYYKKSNRLVSPSILAGLHFLCAKKSVSDADEFFTKLCTGIGLVESSPITALRNVLGKDQIAKNHMHQKEKVQLIITAWNKFRRNERCKVLKIVTDIDLKLI